jgi:acyl transferase domain-containing protein
MLAANLAQPDVAGYVQKCAVDTQTELDVTLACINSPYNVTLSGKEEHIDIVESKLRLDGIFAQKVNTGVAYHSPVMEEMAPKYIELMGALEKDEANVLHIPMISTVTGKTIEPEKLASPQYWASNLASPVQFSQALSNAISAAPKIKLGTARSRPIYDLVEIGPHSTLRRPCNDIIKQIPHKKDVRYTPVLHRTKSSLESVLELVGNLFTYRYDVSATEANRWIRHKGESIHGFLVDAPQYPFNHTQRYWHESRLSLDYRLREPTPREVLGVRVSDWNPLEPKWRRMISVDELPWVADHVVSHSRARYI